MPGNLNETVRYISHYNAQLELKILLLWFVEFVKDEAPVQFPTLLLFCIVQVENEAAMQQLKKMKLEHVHAHDQLTEENLRLQRALAQIQVHTPGTLHCCYGKIKLTAALKLQHGLHALASRQPICSLTVISFVNRLSVLLLHRSREDSTR